MNGFGTNPVRHISAALKSRDRDADIYDRYAAGLYRQALFTLDDAGLAAQVVCDVLVDECTRPAAPAPGDTRRRLSVSAYWHCRELADRLGSRGPLTARDRGAIGLVAFGGLGYAQAGRELAIPPPDMAKLLLAAVHDGLPTAIVDIGTVGRSRGSTPLLGGADKPSCPSAVEDRPADLVSQPLIV